MLNTTLQDEIVAFAFGRHFVSNPDLPFRLRKDIPLTHYNRETFYKVKSPQGYTDYTFSDACKEWKLSCTE